MERGYWVECDGCSNTTTLVVQPCGHRYCKECREDGFATPCFRCHLSRLGEADPGEFDIGGNEV